MAPGRKDLLKRCSSTFEGPSPVGLTCAITVWSGTAQCLDPGRIRGGVLELSAVDAHANTQAW